MYGFDIEADRRLDNEHWERRRRLRDRYTARCSGSRSAAHWNSRRPACSNRFLTWLGAARLTCRPMDRRHQNGALPGRKLGAMPRRTKVFCRAPRLLASAGLAQDENCRVGRSDLTDRIANISDPCATTDDTHFTRRLSDKPRAMIPPPPRVPGSAAWPPTAR